jgi:uncharacterized repeat protein (TIGR03803 family)
LFFHFVYTAVTTQNLKSAKEFVTGKSFSQRRKQMTPRTLLVVLTILLATTVYAQQTNAVYTFACEEPQAPPLGACPSGGLPFSSIIQGSDGNFYGSAFVTAAGAEGGLIFSLTPAGTFQILYEFAPGKKGNYPNGNNPSTLAEGPDGRLYGATFRGGSSDGGTLFALNRDGSGFQLLRSICANCNSDDQQAERGPWVLAGDGNFYGEAITGYRDLTAIKLFRITPATGDIKFLHTFRSLSNLIVGSDGTLYATVSVPAPAIVHYNEVTGVLQETPLDVDAPAEPTLGTNGNLYGLYSAGIDGTGLFEVQLDGSNLQLFPGMQNYPNNDIGGVGQLLFGPDGNIWQVLSSSPTEGDIVTISPTDGSLIQVLTPFGAMSPLGELPLGLVAGADGNLWGVTGLAGQAPQGLWGAGVVFNVTP